MSFIKHNVSHAVVYSNLQRIAQESKILAVVQIFYNDKDSVSIAYTNIADDKRGYEGPYAPVFVNSKKIKVHFFTGEPFLDLVTLAERAMAAVKKEYGSVPGGKVFKVHPKVDGHTVVEEIDPQGETL